MQLDTDNIKKIAEEFTSRAFGTEVPHYLCFSTCFPLSILFDSKQIKNKIICGDFPKGNSSVRHFWLGLDDDGTILDPTIRQFDESIKTVYVGKVLCNNITRQFIQIESPIEEWFRPQYNLWAEPLIDRQPRTYSERPKGFEDRINFLNIKTATVLYNYIEKAQLKERIIETKKFKCYFSPIFKFLNDKTNSDINFIDSLKDLMPEGFNLLLSKAQNNN